jgi:predicted translin family RNA/ssDNA-binding protein
MAIKIIDSVPVRVGISLTNTVATLSGSYKIDKRDGVYTAEALILYYVNETQYAAANQLDVNHIRLVISVGDLAGNIMTLLYNQLKSQYSSTIDI